MNVTPFMNDDVYETALADASGWSSKVIREQIARLRQVAQNLEFKDYHDQSDKIWKLRTSLSIKAYERVLKEREASALELDGAYNTDLLCQGWKLWQEHKMLDPLYWMLHGMLYCHPRNPGVCGSPIDEIVFLKEIVLQIKEASNAQQA